jgi:hypothetical protein
MVINVNLHANLFSRENYKVSKSERKNHKVQGKVSAWTANHKLLR